MGWSANYVNNPDQDHDLIIEIVYNTNDCRAIIQKHEGNLEMVLLANKEDSKVPVGWLKNLVAEAEKSL